jgi:hypothetical protein
VITPQTSIEKGKKKATDYKIPGKLRAAEVNASWGKPTMPGTVSSSRLPKHSMFPVGEKPMAFSAATMSTTKKIFAPIRTKEDAEGALKEVSKALYIFAGLQLVLGVGLLGMVLVLGVGLLGMVFGNPAFVLGLVDAAVYAIAAYYLPKNKSKPLAILVFVVAILTAGMTLLARMGVFVGGQNIILATLAIYVGYRAILATSVYHKEPQVYGQEAC